MLGQYECANIRSLQLEIWSHDSHNAGKHHNQPGDTSMNALHVEEMFLSEPQMHCCKSAKHTGVYVCRDCVAV